MPVSTVVMCHLNLINHLVLTCTNCKKGWSLVKNCHILVLCGKWNFVRKLSIRNGILQIKFRGNWELFSNFGKKIFEKKVLIDNNLSVVIELWLSKVFLKMLLSPIERSKIETLVLGIILSDFLVVILVKRQVVYVNLTIKSVSTSCTKGTGLVVLLTFCEKAVSRHAVLY